MAGLG